MGHGSVLSKNFPSNGTGSHPEEEHISPAKPGLAQDERIENFDRDVFVQIFEEDRDYEEEMSDIVIKEVVKSC